MVQNGQLLTEAEADPEGTARGKDWVGLTLSAASAAYVKHEITFKIGLRIAADRGRNPQTQYVRIQYAYSTDPLRIATDIEHPQHPCVGVKGVLVLFANSRSHNGLSTFTA